MDSYKVRVTKDYLTFCSAHFISFEGTQCERLHGHNYRVTAEVEAKLNDDFLVFDFIALKKILRDITNELDHRMLVPGRSRTLDVTVSEESVKIAYHKKTWVLPREDCAVLPIENSTAELLAKWICDRLREELGRHARAASVPLAPPSRLRVEVEESPGQCAVYDSGPLAG